MVHMQPFTYVLWKISFKTSLENTFAGFFFFKHIWWLEVWIIKWRLLKKSIFVNFARFFKIRHYSISHGSWWLILWISWMGLQIHFKCLCFGLSNIFAKHSIFDDVACILAGRSRNTGILFQYYWSYFLRYSG